MNFDVENGIIIGTMRCEVWNEYNINKWGGDAHLDVARRDEPPGVISALK